MTRRCRWNRLQKKLTQYFLAHGLIKEDDAEVCHYALYRHISRAVGLIALTLLGGLITDFSVWLFALPFRFFSSVSAPAATMPKQNGSAHYTLPP